MELNTFNIPIEPIGYARKELNEMKSRRNAFIMDVLEKGKVPYKTS
jgi:hypothetical protein